MPVTYEIDPARALSKVFIAFARDWFARPRWWRRSKTPNTGGGRPDPRRSRHLAPHVRRAAC